MNMQRQNVDLERLMEQILMLNPALKSVPDRLPLVNKKLEEQLQSEVVVSLKAKDPSIFDMIAGSVIRQINDAKSMLSNNRDNVESWQDQNERSRKADTDQRNVKKEERLSDSSDNETLSIKRLRSKSSKKSIRQLSFGESDSHDGGESVSETVDSIPLSLRRTRRERKTSSNFKYEFLSPVKSSKNSRTDRHGHRRKKRQKDRSEGTVSTTGIIHHCEEEMIVEKSTTSRSYYIKIPSLFSKDMIHEIDLSEPNTARKIFDVRAQEVKQKSLQLRQQQSFHQENKKKKSHKKKDTTSVEALLEHYAQQQQDEENDAVLSQLINVAIGNEDETWKATNALENINNETIDNYGVLPECTSPTNFLGFESQKGTKRRYKSSKAQTNDPPKKRGRKPKVKDAFVSSQPPTKSNLAQFIENFGSECDVPGSATPAASSTMSQPLVSSTTQNFEFIDQQNATSPVMYYFHGNWENGESCQLVTTNSLALSSATHVQASNLNMTIPYEESTIDTSTIPIITQLRHLPQTNIVHNTIVSPVITIQNSPLSTATTNNVVPPPAHSSVSPVVLDLSLKSNMNVSNSSTDSVSYNIQPEVPIEYQMSVDDQFMDETAPLDLSINANSHQMDSMTSLSEQLPKDMFSETQCIVVDDGQDDDFIRRLIETSDFDLGLDQLPDGNNDNRSFKAALDMPLLETVGEDGIGKGNVVSKESTATSLPNDSTYASMTEDSPNYFNCTIGDEYNFADQSTKEIFTQLLDIGPSKSAQMDSNRNEEVEENMNDGSKQQTEPIELVSSSPNCNEEPTTSSQQKNLGLTEANDDVSCIRHNLDVKTSGDTDSKSDESKNSKANAKCTPRVYKRRCTISKNIDSLSSLQVLNENISVTIVPKETNQFPKDNAENVISNRNALGKFENQKETGSKMILCNEKTISAASEPQEVQTMTNKISKDSTILEDIRNERNTSLEKFTVENDEENSAITERLYLKESRNIKEGIFINETTCMTQAAVCFDHAKNQEKVTVESIDLEEAHCCRKNVTIDRLIDVEKGLLDDAIVDNLETRDYGSLADKQQYSQDEENFSEMEIIEYNLSEKLNEAKAPDKVIQIDEIAIENNKKKCSENIEAIENVGGGENINTNQEINNISATQFQDIGKEQEFMASSALNSSQTTNIISESEKKLDVLSSFQDTNDSSHIKSNEKQILILSEIQNVDPCTTMKIKSLSTSNIHTDVQIMETINVADANDVPLNLRAANLNDEANNNTQHIQNDQNTTLINNGNNEKHSSHTDSTQREKVVFSIAKVNLNDETTNLDYVFLSDSDNSSRKSCDETHCHIENNTYERENQFQPHDLSTKSKCNGHNNKKQTRNSPSNTYETNIHVQSDNISNSDNENSADAIPTLLISDSDDEEDTRSTAVANDVIYLKSKGNCAIAGEFPEYEECAVVESQNNENNLTVNTNVQPEDTNKDNTVPEFQMSLLEIESKLDENTLNFEDDDEDLDALILDTSSCCFDSPNEDRFKDSTVVTDVDSNKEIHATTVTAVQNSEIPKLPSIDHILRGNDTTKSSTSVQIFKNFKIPKLNFSNAKSSTSVDNINMQPNVLLERIPAMVHSTIKVKDFNEMIKSNRGNASKQNTTQFAKITRTIKNETAVAARDICTEQPDSTPIQKQPIFKCTFNNLPATVVSKDQAISLTMRFSSPSSSCTNNNGGGGGTGRQRRSHYGIPEAALVFGVTCLPYLENLCPSAVHCRKSHQFNNIDFVFSALNAMNKSEFSLAYSFMYNHFKLYVQFFIVFCNVCAVRNDRVRLLNMVNDCERYPEHAEFLILVFETLVKCGLSPVNACRLMLKRIRDKSTKIIDALVAIILKSDWTMFSDYIENFTQKDYKYNYRTEILEQMAPAVLNNNQTQLKEVFFKCVQTVHCDELPRLLCCSPSLMQCLDLMAATSGQVEH